jgi:hypothetical protein
MFAGCVDPEGEEDGIGTTGCADAEGEGDGVAATGCAEAEHAKGRRATTFGPVAACKALADACFICIWASTAQPRGD